MTNGVVGAAGVSKLIENLEVGKSQTVVLYGTSLTAGGKWGRDLADWLEEKYPGRVQVINSGMSGKASNTGVMHLEEKVIAHQPDTLLVEFAVNDASSYDEGNVDYGIDPGQSRKNLNEIIDRVLRAKPSTEIILQTMNPAWDAPNGNRSGSRRPRLTEYYEGYRQVARERGLRLADHHAVWTKVLESDRALFESYIPDGVHPELKGSTAVTFAGVKRVLLGGL